MITTLSSRVLGRHLRRLREQAGLTGSYVAHVMGYSAAKLSRQESGTHVVAVHELSHLVTQLYGCEQPTLDELEALRQRAAQGRGWWMEVASDIPWHVRAYLEIENEAERIIVFSGDVIPGLLQTADYARAQEQKFSSGDAAEVERTVWLRAQRKVRVYEASSPPALDAVLTEGALRRCVGAGQFGQLDELAERSELPNVSLRILPDSAGLHGITTSYTVLDLPRGVLEPVMYLEYIGGSILVEDQKAIESTMNRHRGISAPDPEGSRKFLKDFIIQNRSGQLGTAVA